MRKLGCCILILCLLVGSVFAAGTIFVPPVPVLSDGAGLETLLYELQIDEECSDVQATMLLKNPTDKDICASFSLPADELSAAPDAMEFYLDGTRTAVPEQIAVPAGGYLTVQYHYKAASSLRDAKVISFDLSQLVFTEGAKIGRFSLSMHLCEEDIPLVTDIKPVNYTFADQTVSIVLYDFAPSRLLDRVYIAKDTWKDLASSREFEPNEAQQYFLENYHTWFSEGMPIGTDNYVGYDYNIMLGKDPDDLETFYEGGYDDLYEHTNGFVHAAAYLYQKAHMTPSGDTQIDPNMCGYDPREPLLYAESFSSVTQRDQFSTVVCVEFADNPALEDRDLYVTLVTDHNWEDNPDPYGDAILACTEEDVLVTQQQAVMTAISMTQMTGGLPLMSHVALLPGELSTTPEEIAAYVDAIGATFYIRQMLYDGTVTPYPVTPDEWGYYDDEGNFCSMRNPIPYVIGYCGAENEPIADAATSYSDSENRTLRYRGIQISDPVLEVLDIPAVMLYRGFVHEENSKCYVEFTEGHFRAYSVGISLAANVAATERGQELLSAVQARRNETRSRVDAEIAGSLSDVNVEPPAVSETEPDVAAEASPPLSPLIFILPMIVLIAVAVIVIILKKEGTKHI